ncbi:MAG TPA: oxidoreductase, partial [Longimicrobium sp.]|nr:oxidoreductase [Longimicrobium sp.]
DHDYPVAAARLASARGAKRFLLVSSLGANARSRVFYNRVKGEVERDVAAVPFEGVALLRPSLILGPRAERRTAEDLAQRLMPLAAPLLVGPLRGYRAIDATTIARAMVRLAREGFRGVRVVESDEIAALGSA